MVEAPVMPPPRLSDKALAELSHRLSVEADAGIDIRRTWQREVEISRGRIRPYFVRIRDGILRGESVSAALAEATPIFPPLFLEMVQVGETTGTLPQVLRRLEAHFRRRVQAQRIFLAAIAWPVLELLMAIVVIGVLIWIMGIVAGRTGRTTDVLGFGLIGTPGLLTYVVIVAAISGCIAYIAWAWRCGLAWTRPLQRAVGRLPGVGRALEKIALARAAWALHLTMNVEMDLRRVVPLVMRAAGGDQFTRHSSRIAADVASGLPLHAAFARSGAFPTDFLDALEVAEESGQIVEAMDRLSRRYEEEAEAAIKTLATIAGFAVAVLVMGVIVLLIFRLASFYFGTIQEAVDMVN